MTLSPTTGLRMNGQEINRFKVNQIEYLKVMLTPICSSPLKGMGFPQNNLTTIQNNLPFPGLIILEHKG